MSDEPHPGDVFISNRFEYKNTVIVYVAQFMDPEEPDRWHWEIMVPVKSERRPARVQSFGHNCVEDCSPLVPIPYTDLSKRQITAIHDALIHWMRHNPDPLVIPYGSLVLKKLRVAANALNVKLEV